MSKEKKLEKIVDTYKSLLSLLIVAIFGLIGFLFINAEHLSLIRLCVVICAIVANAVIIIAVFFLYKKYLDKLGEV